VHLARRYLEQNDHRDVALTDLARTAAVSKHHLARAFRAVYGQPPARFHRELRLRRAAEQLAAGAMTTAAAAERFGFSDAAAFCRAFKRVYDVPPGRYCARRWAA
jgi:AraC family transcriptional regulator